MEMLATQLLLFCVVFVPHVSKICLGLFLLITSSIFIQELFQYASCDVNIQ